MKHTNHTACVNHINHINNALQAGEASKLRKLSRINAYMQSPKVCKQCLCTMEYNKRTNIFCSRSCSRTYSNLNNKIHDVTKIKISESISKINDIKLQQKQIDYKYNPKLCKQCNNSIPYELRKRNYCSTSCRKQFRQYVASNISKIGGNKNRHSFWYISPTAGKVYLESSYEFKVASELDLYGIRWIRPKHIPYTINNKQKRYFPDFYLSDFDVYLDPKNSFLAQQDAEKIKTVEQQHKIHVLVLDKNSLSWSIIKEKINSLRFVRTNGGALDL